MRDMNYDGDRDVIAGALEKQHMPISAPNSDQRNVLAVLVAVLAAVLEETILWESIDHRDIFIICATKAYILYTYIRQSQEHGCKQYFNDVLSVISSSRRVSYPRRECRWAWALT